MNAKTRIRYGDIKILKQRNRLRYLNKRLHKHAIVAHYFSSVLDHHNGDL